ncbi:hypothetical protein F4818DRAFT_396220 [Hypoxylon cercidicola]|nr:hypothetical protein F4818DRAFT_396220 [Hypoxylon cercidicola]
MCIETWRIHQQCGCRIYLSTYVCNIARGRAHGADNVLTKTKFLPDKRPKIPVPCKISTATSPSATICPRCAKREREEREAGANAAAQPTSTTSTALQGKIFQVVEMIQEKADKGEHHWPY